MLRIRSLIAVCFIVSYFGRRAHPGLPIILGKSWPGKGFCFTLHEATRDPVLELRTRQVLAARSHSKRDAVCCGMSSVSVAGSKLKSIKLDQISQQIKTDEKDRRWNGAALLH